MRRKRLVQAAAILLIIPFLQGIPGSAIGAPSAAPSAPFAPSDNNALSRKVFPLDGETIATPAKYTPPADGQRARTAGTTPPVGTVRQWVALDMFHGNMYRKDYTLRGVGANIEAWVANDLSFPAGDCRMRIPALTQITDAQVAAMIAEFDNNIYPKEVAAFSRPPDRDGTNATLKPDENGNGGVYTGDGNKTVTLIDNLRDTNYYNLPAAPDGNVGFFSRQFTELLDRNILNVDAFDWTHRTGETPPHAPTDDPCTNRPGRPRAYEANIAHEWQHVAMYYTDPLESGWLEEGISNFAEAYTGYVKTTTTVFDPRPDRRINCYQGFGSVQTPYNPIPRDCGGPDNSLNLWGDGKSLADFGQAFSFTLFVYDRYGIDFVTRLHRDGERRGFASVDAALEAEGVPERYQQVLHDFQSSTLVDKIVGEPQGGLMLGVPKKRVTTPSLRSTVNFANPDVNIRPGVSPNGADYNLLKKADGTVLTGRELRSLEFSGVRTLPTLPLLWTVVSNDPDRAGNPVLWSGNDNNMDSAAVTPVTVPTADPTLRMLAKYGAEFGYDFGYVVVSTDGGKTYSAVAGDKTVDAPLGPGLNGTTKGFEPHSFDLSAYAGKSVLLGLRYVSDGGTNEGGLLVDDVTLGAGAISDGSSLDAFDSPTEASPIQVHNWNVRLIGYDERHSAALQIEINGKDNFTLNQYQLLFFSLFPKVVAIVGYDEPTERVQQYAPYTLKVNGVTQPGGA